APLEKRARRERRSCLCVRDHRLLGSGRRSFADDPPSAAGRCVLRLWDRRPSASAGDRGGLVGDRRAGGWPDRLPDSLGSPRAGGGIVCQAPSAPVVRGIFVTATVPLTKPTDKAALQKVFADAYGNEFFIRLVEGSPDVAAVMGTNFADIGVAVQGNVAKVFV